MKIFLAAVALVFAVFFVPEAPLGLSDEAGQIALAVVGILAFPVAVGIAIFRPGTGALPQASPEAPELAVR